MKINIASALRTIKRFKGQIAERTSRMEAAAVYMEGSEPAFDFNKSMQERADLTGDLIRYQAAVATANALGSLADNTPVYQAIRKLDEMKGAIALLKKLPVRAKKQDVEIQEYTDYDVSLEKHVRREKKITWVSALSQVERADMVEKLTLEFEQLNDQLEQFNRSYLIEV